MQGLLVKVLICSVCSIFTTICVVTVVKRFIASDWKAEHKKAGLHVLSKPRRQQEGVLIVVEKCNGHASLSIRLSASYQGERYKNVEKM